MREYHMKLTYTPINQPDVFIINVRATNGSGYHLNCFAVNVELDEDKFPDELENFIKNLDDDKEHYYKFAGTNVDFFKPYCDEDVFYVVKSVFFRKNNVLYEVHGWEMFYK